MNLPEHSSTRDPAIARDVPCPPPLPVVPAPARGVRALAFPAAKPFSATRPDSYDDAARVELVTIDQPGAERSVVTRSTGERATFSSFQLVALDPVAQAKAGDFVLVAHLELNETVMRAVVRPGGKTARRLAGFGAGIGGVDFPLVPGAFRVIARDLDPGSLVAIPLSDRVELAMVLAVAGELVVALDHRAQLRALHRSSIAAMPVAPRPRKGMRVYAPFATTLDPATIDAIEPDTAQIGIVWDAFPSGSPRWVGAGAYLDRDLSLDVFRKP